MKFKVLLFAALVSAISFGNIVHGEDEQPAAVVRESEELSQEQLLAIISDFEICQKLIKSFDQYMNEQCKLFEAFSRKRSEEERLMLYRYWKNLRDVYVENSKNSGACPSKDYFVLARIALQAKATEVSQVQVN